MGRNKTYKNPNKKKHNRNTNKNTNKKNSIKKNQTMNKKNKKTRRKTKKMTGGKSFTFKNFKNIDFIKFNQLKQKIKENNHSNYSIFVVLPSPNNQIKLKYIILDDAKKYQTNTFCVLNNNDLENVKFIPNPPPVNPPKPPPVNPPNPPNSPIKPPNSPIKPPNSPVKSFKRQYVEPSNLQSVKSFNRQYVEPSNLQSVESNLLKNGKNKNYLNFKNQLKKRKPFDNNRLNSSTFKSSLFTNSKPKPKFKNQPYPKLIPNYLSTNPILWNNYSRFGITADAGQSLMNENKQSNNKTDIYNYSIGFIKNNNQKQEPERKITMFPGKL